MAEIHQYIWAIGEYLKQYLPDNYNILDTFSYIKVSSKLQNCEDCNFTIKIYNSYIYIGTYSNGKHIIRSQFALEDPNSLDDVCKFITDAIQIINDDLKNGT